MADGLVLQVGRYGLFGTIAAGGMAEVHFARQAGTGGFQKTIAIKRLLPHIAQNPEFRTMIYEEAKIASRIRHPNVVQPLDVIATDDEVLLAMEYVHGEALSKLIQKAHKRKELVPPPVGMAICCEMLQGLHAAHEAKDEQGVPLGIVHRDVSPQNVIVGVDGVARVIDFGIAKAVTSSDSTLVGQVKGKLPYLAPEQFAGEPATRASDIYAACCIAWEVLVGRRLFDGDSETAIAARILHAPIDPPSAFVDGVPPELDALILRGLDRNPHARFATARELALAIEQVMPIATASTVGAFVEHLAAAELKKRADQLARVERMQFDFTPDPISTKRSYPPNGALQPPPPQMIMPREQLPQPPAPPPPTQVMPQLSRAPTVAMPEAPRPPPVRPPTWKEELKPPPAGALRKPELEIPNVNWLPQDGMKAITITKPRRVSGAMFAIVVLLIGVAGFFVALPTIVKRGYEKSAAAQGISLTIAQTEVSRHEITLLDVGLKMPDLAWMSAHANAIHIDLQGFEPRVITVRGLDVQLDGSLVDLTKDLERWRAVHKVGAPGEDEDSRHRPKVSLEDAHVTWRGAFGKTTTVVAENVSFEAYGDDDVTRGSAPLITIATKSGYKAGPLRVDYERSPLATRIWFRFDPTGARTSSMLLTVDPTGAASLEANIPRSRASELWLPASFGVAEVSLTINAKLNPGGKSEGRVNALVLTSSAQELRFDAALVGTDATQPLGVAQGTLQIGTQKLRPGGTLLFGPSGVDFSFFGVCDAKPDASLFVATFDTSDLEDNGRVAIAKDARCTGGKSP